MDEQEYNSFRVALAGLDLTEMDDYIIPYSAAICRTLSVERIIFVHVAESLELPEKVLEEYPDLLAPLDESIEIDIRRKIDVHFSDISGTEVSIEVKEGNTIEKILRLSKIKEADLILLGRKRNLKGSGIVSSHIARNAPCSLLLVPENPPLTMEKVMVPLDFSSHAAMAFHYAQLISQNTGAALNCIHLYRVPSGYHSTGKSYEEFARIMESHAHHDYQKFLTKLGVEEAPPCDFLLTQDGDQAERLYQHCELSKASLILFGSRGRTSASVLLMGSLAEKLTYLDADIPLLIIKKKGENMGFFQALLRV